MNNSKKSETVATVTNSQNQTFGILAQAIADIFGPRVFPIVPGTKVPPKGESWRTTPITLTGIDTWMLEYPDHAIGMATGCAPGSDLNLLAIDCDAENENVSVAVWNALLDFLDDDALLLPRTRQGSHRWAAIIQTDADLSGSEIQFETHIPGEKGHACAIEFKADGQYVVLAGQHKSGSHYEWPNGAPWDRGSDDIPMVRVNDMPSLAKTIIEAVQVDCDLSATKNTLTGNRKAAANDGDGMHTPVGHDLPLIQRRDMIKFALTSDGLGYADDGHDEWRDAVWGCMDLLHDEPGAHEFIRECCKSTEHPEWQAKTDALLRNASKRTERSGNITGKSILDLTIYNKDSDGLATWLKFEKAQQSKRSRESFERHRQTLTEADNADALDIAKIAITLDTELLTDEWERLLPTYKQQFNDIHKETLTNAQAKKHLAKDKGTLLEIEAEEDHALSKRPLPARIFDDVIAEGKAFVNQHGEYFVEFETGSVMPVLSPEFAQWCMRRAQQLGQMADDKTCKTVALNVRAKLKDRPLDEIDVHRRVAQMGVGTNSSPIEIYVNMNNAEGQVARISADGVELIASSDAPVRFVSGSEAGVLRKPTRPLRGTLQERQERFWYHMPVPVGERMKFLGTMVNAFFTLNHQPILVIHSPPPGGDAKSPTLYRWRQLIDPRTTALPSAPSDRKTFVRTMATGWCVAIDDVAPRGLSPEWQKKLNSYSTGGTDTEPTLYLTGATTVMETSGPLGMTTNHHPVTNPETLARTVQILFEKLKHKRSAAVTELEFADEADALRWTLFELVSQVIRVLPTIADRSGHRFDGYAQIVNALHEILDIPGSLAETINAQLQASVPELMDSNPFVLDIVDYVLTTQPEERFIDISPGSLLQKLIRSEKNPTLAMLRLGRTGSAESSYPSNNAAVKTALTSDPEVVALLGLDVSESPKVPNKQGELVSMRDRYGVCLRISLNEGAPKREDVPYDIVEAVERMKQAGKPIPDEWRTAYNAAMYLTL